MPLFDVTVKSLSGETQSFERDSENRFALLASLRKEGWVPVEITESLSAKNVSGIGQLLGRNGVRVPKRKDLRTFMSSFSTLLRSGMDLDRCLKTLEKESREPLRGILGEMSRSIRQGASLSEAMGQSRAFSEFDIRVIRAGEYGGNLQRALGQIATALERESDVRSKVRNAVAYPAFLLVFGSFAFFIMLFFILPKFSDIYVQMGAKLPISTQIMLNTSVFFRSNFIWILPLLLVFGGGMLKFILQFRKNVVLDRLRMRVPGLGKLIQEMEVATFLRSLGFLLQSGLPVTHSLQLVSKVLNSVIFSSAAIDIEEGVQKGGKISTEMRKHNLFSETVLNLVAVGEESGNLDSLMLEVSEEMEQRMDQLIKGALTLLEPLLILAVGCIIGLMVMATLLPILSLSAGLRR
jgi:type IV pilus assembly protein PilC